jgi:hypothetical protein
VLVLLGLGPVRADTVTFDLGGGTKRTLEGVIVSETVDEVVLEFDYDRTLRITRSKVITMSRGDHPVKECRAKFAEAKEAKSADAWLALARYAQENDVTEYHREACRRVLEIDADNVEARKALGYVKVKGRWVTRAQARRYEDWEKDLGDMKREFAGRNLAMVAPIKTTFFEMKCGSTEEVEKQYLAFLQNALFPLYNKQFPETKFPWYNKEPGKIFILANVEQFRDVSGATMGVGGFFIPPRNEVYAFHGSFGMRGTTLHVLAHEACHVYQWRIFKDLTAVPTWLVEGMAVYFGDGAEFGFSFRDDPSEFRAGSVKIVPPYDRVVVLKRFISANMYLPLEKLLRVPHVAFHGGLYSNAWLVNFWCLDGDKYGAHGGEGRKLLEEYIRHASSLTEKNGGNKPKHLKAEADVFAGLVKKHLGRTLENWDEELKRFVRELQVPQLGTWTPSTRRWKGQGLELRCPSGLKPVEQQELLPGEAVAFGPRAGSHPRITVWSRSNDFLIRTGEKDIALVSRWLEELYAIEPDGWVKEPAPVKGGRMGMVEAVVVGKRRVQVLPGEKKPGDQPVVKVRFRAAATPAKVYFFGCESMTKGYDEADKKYFDYFFENVALAR